MHSGVNLQLELFIMDCFLNSAEGLPGAPGRNFASFNPAFRSLGLYASICLESNFTLFIQPLGDLHLCRDTLCRKMLQNPLRQVEVKALDESHDAGPYPNPWLNN